MPPSLPQGRWTEPAYRSTHHPTTIRKSNRVTPAYASCRPRNPAHPIRVRPLRYLIWIAAATEDQLDLQRPLRYRLDGESGTDLGGRRRRDRHGVIPRTRANSSCGSASSWRSVSSRRSAAHCVTNWPGDQLDERLYKTVQVIGHTLETGSAVTDEIPSGDISTRWASDAMRIGGAYDVFGASWARSPPGSSFRFILLSSSSNWDSLFLIGVPVLASLTDTIDESRCNATASRPARSGRTSATSAPTRRRTSASCAAVAAKRSLSQ